MNEETITRLLTSGALGAQQRGRGCLDELTLAALADGALSDAARDRIEHHLAECGSCCRQLAMLLPPQARIGGVEVPADLIARATASRSEVAGPARGWSAWVAAAAALLGLAIGVSFWLPAAAPSEPAAAVSTAAPPTIPIGETRRQTLVAPAPSVVAPTAGSLLVPGRTEIRWQELPLAIDYGLQLTDEDGDVVWEERQGSASALLPGSLTLAGGARYYLTVRAYLRDGKSVRSTAVGFTAAEGGR